MRVHGALAPELDSGTRRTRVHRGILNAMQSKEHRDTDKYWWVRTPAQINKLGASKGSL